MLCKNRLQCLILYAVCMLYVCICCYCCLFYFYSNMILSLAKEVKALTRGFLSLFFPCPPLLDGQINFWGDMNNKHHKKQRIRYYASIGDDMALLSLLQTIQGTQSTYSGAIRNLLSRLGLAMQLWRITKQKEGTTCSRYLSLNWVPIVLSRKSSDLWNLKWHTRTGSSKAC